MYVYKGITIMKKDNNVKWTFNIAMTLACHVMDLWWIIAYPVNKESNKLMDIVYVYKIKLIEKIKNVFIATHKLEYRFKSASI